MSRPLRTWIAFGACLGVVLAGMAWASLMALRLDRAETEARKQAALEESVRLALWRMDSALAPIIAQESARPYFAYTAFYPMDRAYTRMFSEIKRGEVLVPSPLLTETPPQVLLHFQFEPDGALTSPQVPTGTMRALAERGYTTREKIEAAARRLAEFQALVGKEALLAALPRAQPQAPLPVARSLGGPNEERFAPQQQAALNAQERQARQRVLDISNYAPIPDRPPLSNLDVAVTKPVWMNGTLVLARRISVAGREYIQGCWLDWAGLKRTLVESVADLFPRTDLQPVTSEAPDESARMLAALPVVLVPGEAPVYSSSAISPIRLSLIIAWGCVVAGAAAVAILLQGAVSLSERRGAFVSAVTHELRTPLTTFRLYSEMLANGMVPEEEKRREYLHTLCVEADRLAHLVENVLAYARLERGAMRTRMEDVPVGGLIESVKRRLIERARQAGMTLEIEVKPEARSASVRADLAAVERILFNLVDNACKYAASAADRRIQLDAGREKQSVVLRVRDHGPGVSGDAARRLFRPFSKSAREAAGSAPGVGLGLALSRRLAREMGGDLSLDAATTDGACFILRLPACGGNEGIAG